MGLMITYYCLMALGAFQEDGTAPYWSLIVHASLEEHFAN
jgi:hypothetical protein